MKLPFYFLFFLVFYTHFLSAQTRLFFSVQPTVANRIMLYSSDNHKNKDSFSKVDQSRITLGANALFSLPINKDLSLMTGLKFQSMGFTRRKENIRFLDTIHPSIGIRADQVDVGPAWVDFRYQYYYLSIPFLFTQEINTSNRGKSGSFHWVFGGAISGLIKRDINAKFFGFSFGKDKKVSVTENDWQPALINANLQAGFRYENLIFGDQTSIYVQPNLMIPVLLADYGLNKHLLYGVGLEVGLVYSLDNK
jgi:hypothetical protein